MLLFPEVPTLIDYNAPKETNMQQQRGPGGCIGFIVLLVLLAVGIVANIEWMQTCGGIGLVVWAAMLIFGFLFGARG